MKRARQSAAHAERRKRTASGQSRYAQKRSAAKNGHASDNSPLYRDIDEPNDYSDGVEELRRAGLVAKEKPNRDDNDRIPGFER